MNAAEKKNLHHLGGGRAGSPFMVHFSLLCSYHEAIHLSSKCRNMRAMEMNICILQRPETCMTVKLPNANESTQELRLWKECKTFFLFKVMLTTRKSDMYRFSDIFTAPSRRLRPRLRRLPTGHPA